MSKYLNDIALVKYLKHIFEYFREPQSVKAKEIIHLKQNELQFFPTIRFKDKSKELAYRLQYNEKKRYWGMLYQVLVCGCK